MGGKERATQWSLCLPFPCILRPFSSLPPDPQLRQGPVPPKKRVLCLTETGVPCEVPQESLALFLQVAAAPAGAGWRHSEVGGAGVHVVGHHVKACPEGIERAVRSGRGTTRLQLKDPLLSTGITIFFLLSPNFKMSPDVVFWTHPGICAARSAEQTCAQRGWGIRQPQKTHSLPGSLGTSSKSQPRLE